MVRRGFGEAQRGVGKRPALQGTIQECAVWQSLEQESTSRVALDSFRSSQ